LDVVASKSGWRHSKRVTVDRPRDGIELMLSRGTSLNGQLLDQHEQPLTGVAVWWGGSAAGTTGATADTDAQGRFTIPALGPGELVVELQGGDAISLEPAHVTVTDLPPPELVLHARTRGARLTLILTGPPVGAWLYRGTVEAGDNLTGLSALPQAGAFVWAALAPGPYTLIVSKRGKAPYAEHVEVVDDRDVALHVQ
jgi:hypothetical protein